MLSVILYGRNDNYGYNLHKRAAISFNCLADILADPDDEIVFVDYNTANDLPTFPEAIRDTLTPKARGMLRTIRVRGDVHQRVQKDSRLFVNEPLARNIALRRVNPKNHWVLSTNTDMVFIPRQAASLNAVLEHLEDGYYALPRFEVPETLWESIDRQDPATIQKSFAAYGNRYQLNETVLIHPYQYYDGPGDFQLLPRQVAQDLDGFHEAMIYGWHVDSNLCKRLHLHFGATRSLKDALYGYHCDHTRVTTPAHGANRVENDWGAFFSEVTRADLPQQRETWGLPNQAFEEISLATVDGFYARLLDAVIPQSSRQPADVVYTEQTFGNNVYYNTQHTIAFLVDSLLSLPRETRLAYFGDNRHLLEVLDRFLEERGWTAPSFHCGYGSAPPAAREADGRHLRRFVPGRTVAEAMAADLFLLDMRCPEDTGRVNSHGFTVLGFTPDTFKLYITRLKTFLELAIHEQRSIRIGRAPRKFMTIGLQNTIFERYITDAVGLIAVPFSCHIRHGFLRDDLDFTTARAVFELLDTLEHHQLVQLHQHIVAAYGQPLRPGDYPLHHPGIDVLVRDALAQKADPNAGAPTTGRLHYLAMALLNIVFGWYRDAASYFAAYLALCPAPDQARG